MKKTIQKQYLFLAAIMAAAFLFRLFLSRYRFAVCFDEVNYLKLAMSAALNGITHALHPYWSPFYSQVTALFIKVIPMADLPARAEFAGRLVSILSGTLIIIPLFHLIRMFFQEKAAFLGVFLMAFNPDIAFMNTTALTEPLYLFISLTGVVWGWQALNGGASWKWPASGLLFGLAYLTRPEGIGFFGVFLGVSGLVFLYRHFNRSDRWNRSDRAMLPRIVLMVLGFLVVSTPNFIYLHMETGEWTISAKGKSLQQAEAVVFEGHEGEGYNYLLLNSDNTELLLDQMMHSGEFIQAEEKRGRPVIRVTPALLIKKYVTNLYKVLEAVPRVVNPVLFLFLLFGLFGQPWDRSRFWRDGYLLAFLLFYWFLVVPLFHVNDRYFISALPLSYVWISEGVFVISRWVSQTLKNIIPGMPERYTGLPLVLLLVFLIFSAQLARVVMRDPASPEYWADPIEQKAAGRWLKAHADSPPVIMSKNHTAGFYAGSTQIRQSVSIPLNTWDRVVQYARVKNVNYLLLSERYLEDYPRLKHLFLAKEIPDDLQLIYQQKGPEGYQTVIYKFLDQ